MAGLSHRQTEILNIARAFGRVMVEDLAKRFEVSAQTIRKDLNDLCDERSLTRIHGGAIIASGVENLAYEARRFVAAEEKKAIGAAAAARIPNGCSLFINIGTTTEEVASALTSHEDLLVITNNLIAGPGILDRERGRDVGAAQRGSRARGRGLAGAAAIELPKHAGVPERPYPRDFRTADPPQQDAVSGQGGMVVHELHALLTHRTDMPSND